jgi:glycine/D-amino acid oxidase-like deaminating enzyme
VIEHSYWWDTVSSTKPAPPSAQPEQAHVDVAIVGAGYTGLAAARSLARAGASVLVLERDGVGSGASSRNAGQVLTGLKLDAATLVQRYGKGRARELFDVSLESIARLETLIVEEAIDCEYRRTGHIQAASKPSHFRGFLEEQALLSRVFDHRVEVVAASEQWSELGSRVYHGLLVDERSGGLNPAQFVHGLAAAAVRAGAQILTGAAVAGIEKAASGWALMTANGPIDARDVLIATDAYTTSATPALQRRLIPIGSYIIVTEPLDEATARGLLPRGRMAFDSNHFLYYFRLTADRRLLFGGRAEFSTPTTDATQRAAAILHRGMTTVFPDLATVHVEYAWSGMVGFTRDQLPHAGRLDGLYYAGGYCGHGIAMATSLGEVIARRMSGDPIAHPLLDQPFPPIPLYHGKPWFLPAAGAFFRVKDWVS